MDFKKKDEAHFGKA